MYTKSTKYKYRGHRFDGNPPLLSAQNNSYLQSSVNRPPLLDTAPNSMLQYYNQNTNIAPYIPQQQVSSTSLSADGKIDKIPPATDNDSNEDNVFMQGLDAVGQLYPRYTLTKNIGNMFGDAMVKNVVKNHSVATDAAAANAASDIATKGGGWFNNVYENAVEEALKGGATQEAAAKAGEEAVASSANNLVGGIGAAAGYMFDAYKGFNQDFSEFSPYSKDDAKAATTNILGNNPLSYSTTQTLWSNLANNVKDFTKNMKQNVNFVSNSWNPNSVAKEWENNQMLNYTSGDLHRGAGRKFLDTLVGTGKGVLTGGLAGGIPGAIIGGGIALAQDMANNLFENRNAEKILTAQEETNNKMFQQAQNRLKNIRKMNVHNSLLGYAALGGKLFDQGGTMLNQFETGGSHEENPYGGILQGVAPDGQPNLVEQGETKWNDENYIFSKRLKVNKQLAKEFNLPKEFIGKSFADAVSKWGERFKEMENDALSIATQNAIYTRASEAQEALRANNMMKQLNEQMANLTPEEQQNLLMQMQQQPMETQQMQYPMGSEPMQNEIPQDYAEGGHLFAGTTPDLDDTSNNTDTKNTEDDWQKIRDAVKLVGSKTSNEPSPEYTYNAQFRIAVNNYWRDRVNKVKTKADAEQFEKDYNKYQDMYADIVKMSASGTDMNSEKAKEKVASLQKAWRALGLDDYIPEGSMKGITQIITGNESKSDAQKKDFYDGMFGPQTFARAFKVDDDVINLGKQKGISWDIYGNNAWFDKARYNRGRQFLEKNPAYQEAIEKGVPAEELPEEYKPITVPEGYTPEQAKAYLKGQGYTFDKEDLEDLLNDKYYFNKGETPQTQDSTDEIVAGTTPELLPTWMRGVGALLPFAFLGQKSDYSNADMIQAPKIGFSPIADYLKYRPLDKQYYLNTANAKQQNLRNNIINLSGGNRAAAINNLMLADLQAQDEVGKLYRMAEEYNADQRAKVAAQNADVNKFNSNGFYNADQWNANAEFQARQARAQMRHNIDTMTAQANGANLTQGIQNIIGIGDENARLNMIASNPALAAYIGENFGVKYKTPKTTTEATTSRNGGYLTIKKRRING